MNKGRGLLVVFLVFLLFFQGVVVSAEADESVLKIGSIIKFGSYDWQVLDVQGNHALLITNYVISCEPFYRDSDETCWENSYLRAFLNHDFCMSSFSSKELNAILDVQVSTNTNELTKVSGGPTTTDKVFVLSLEEVFKYFGESNLPNYSSEVYSDNSISDQYNICRKSTHLGCTYIDGFGDKHTVKNDEASFWWLRTLGKNEDRVVSIDYDGSIHIDGYQGKQEQGGVRPSIWIDLNDIEIKVINGDELPLSVLRKGSKSEEVKFIQERLIELGYLNDIADGSFGKKTEAAIKAFQADYGLEENGIATIGTIRLLFPIDKQNKSTDKNSDETSKIVNEDTRNQSANSTVKDDYDLAYVIRGKNYWSYWVIDTRNKVVRSFTTDDYGVLAGTYTGDLKNGADVTYKGGVTEHICFKWAANDSKLIIDGYFEASKTDVSSALKYLNSPEYHDITE